MVEQQQQQQPRPWVSPKLCCGLGNRLFQYAAAAGLAEDSNTRLVFYLPACLGADHGAIATLFRMFPQVPVIGGGLPPVANIKESPNSLYDYEDPAPLAEPYINVGGSIVLEGFRQSPLYFPNEVRQLDPDWLAALGGVAISRALEEELCLGLDAEKGRSYALHIRLGDYKYLPHHQVPLQNYYRRALSKVPDRGRIVLFSDEPGLCEGLVRGWLAEQEQLREARLELIVAPARADVESLWQMSRCWGGTIAANSTFSWWGAWFARRSGAAWATFPAVWGAGLPAPTDLFPSWGTVIPVD